jgi:NAD(P)H-nitrite reductase large subunit
VGEDEDIVVCRCEEINRSEILQAVEDGARTVSGVKRRTRAGMGLCQGRICERFVAKIIATETNQLIEEVVPATHRPPVRPIELRILANEEDE